jgi:uncharacterized membrane protein
MFLKQRDDNKVIEYQEMSGTILKVIIAIAVTFAITAIFWVSPILDIVSTAVQTSGF